MVSGRWKLFSLGAGLLLLAASLLCVGCSSSGQTRYRFINALSGANFGSVDLLIDTVIAFPSVAPNTATGYTKISGGSHQVLVNSAGTSNGLIPTQAISFSSGDTTLLAATNSAAENEILPPFIDNNTAPATNNFNIRFINGSTSYGNVDVYIYAPPLDITTKTPQITNLAFGAASNYLMMALGSYEIVIAPAGIKQNVIDTGGISYGTGAVRTFVALNSSNYLILNDLN
jgi:hypothetical protein